MSRRMILHIGAEKTATTYLQNFFSVNREAFEAHGLLYPRTRFAPHSQISLVAALHELDHGAGLEFGPRDVEFTVESEWMPLIESLNRQDRFDRVLLSVELFSSRLRSAGLAKLAELMSMLEGYDVQIVYYFRRQDAFFQSWYSTHVKAGGTRTLGKAFETHLNNRWFLDSYFLLTEWRNHFSRARFVVRPYDHVVKVSDVLQDFLASIGVDAPGDLAYPELDRNVSWGPAMLAFARYVNEQFGAELGDRRYPLLRAIAERGSLPRAATGNLLSLADRDRLMARYEQSNRNLCKEHGFDYDAIFAGNLGEEHVDPDSIELSRRELASLVLSLV